MRYVIILFLLFGCKAIEEAKDRKAVGRVLSSADLTAKVGKRVAPCANDTTLLHDTTIVVDTQVKYDTTVVIDTQSNDLIRLVTKTVYVDKVRTVKEIIIDRSLQNQLTDSIAVWKQRAYNSANSELAAKAQVQAAKRRTWIFIGIGLLLLAAIIIILTKRK